MFNHQRTHRVPWLKGQVRCEKDGFLFNIIIKDASVYHQKNWEKKSFLKAAPQWAQRNSKDMRTVPLPDFVWNV